MPNYKKSLLGSSTMPFGTGGSFTLMPGHHHHHLADGSCCGHTHEGEAEEAAEKTAACGHNHAPGKSCSK